MKTTTQMQNIPNIVTQACLTTVKWSLWFFVATNAIWGGIVWHLHNKLYDPVISEFAVNQDGHSNNQNVSRNKI